MKIYVSDQIPEQIRTNLPNDNVTYLNSSSISTSDLSEIQVAWGFDQHVQAILDTPHHQLNWIQSFSAGIDYFPKQQLIDQNITLTNTSGVHSVAIANTVLLYALYFMRDMNLALNMRRQKQWDDARHYDELTLLPNKKWLIFGTGHIGQEIAKEAQVLGGHVTGVNHSGHPAPHFDATVADTAYSDVIQDADIIVNILPLTTETKSMFDAEFFNQLKDLYLFVNVGRGPSVDTTALIEALDKGLVKHAALDVFEKEPLTSDSPLWNYPQVLITPHNSAVSSEMLPGVHNVFVTNLEAFLKDGHPTTNIADLTRGY
jgi:D-2-hydroxyacid dehydrogenase (NADP+)